VTANVRPAALSLAELLADLSLVTDLGMGLAPETSLRACGLATGLARAMDTPEETVAASYYTALLLHLGCTAYAHEAAMALGGDDIAVREVLARAEPVHVRQVVTGYLPAILQGTSLPTKVRVVATVAVRGRRLSAESGRATCEVASHTARRLGLPGVVAEALYQGSESWNGKGGPQGLAGEAIALPTRIAHVAAVGTLFAGLGGLDTAVAVVRRRAGGDLDPAIAERFCRQGSSLLAELDGVDARAVVVRAEPAPRRLVGEAEVDRIASAFGDLADLKSPYLLGHSAAVAELATAAGRHLGLDDLQLRTLRRAGLLHDLGRVGVPSGVWDKAGPLTTSEWERVRLHPYHTERILIRSPELAPAGRLAGLHHERQDGTGYHRQATGREIPLPARVLAVADAYQAMGQPRPHRAALPAEHVASVLREQGTRGRLNVDAVTAVLAAPDAAAHGGEAGQRVLATGRSRCCGCSRSAAPPRRSRVGWSSHRRPPAITCSTSTPSSRCRPGRRPLFSRWSTICCPRAATPANRVLLGFLWVS